MKLILSRKGFDSQYGGIPSPILPDGRLVPFPIPSRHDRHTMGDVNLPDSDVSALLRDLSGGAHHLGMNVHLDPDLARSPEGRLPGWRPAFGQTDAAQSHLAGMNVTVGDVFLFFGWFRRVERNAGFWQYVRGAPHLHVIFGWLEVGEVLPVVKERERALLKFPWIANHPHVASPTHYTSLKNSLYIATPTSRYSATAAFGGGRFSTYGDALCLTKPGHSRSVWSLPAWFMPGQATPALSYHGDLSRWEPEGDRVQLRSVAKGQEFVLDGAYYPQLDQWLEQVVGRHS
jgi:hypothetical protein